MDGRGVRCVSDRPWITVAETCECAMAYLAVGDRQMAHTLFGWAQQFRHDDDGRYWTGTVFPDEARFPGGERSTYTAASVILCRRRPRRRHPRLRAVRRDRRRPAPADGA